VVNHVNPPAGQMKHAAMKHGAQTQIHVWRHDRPLPVIGVEEMAIQVLMSTELSDPEQDRNSRDPTRDLEGWLGLRPRCIYERARAKDTMSGLSTPPRRQLSV
jgi:hypothetical protein